VVNSIDQDGTHAGYDLEITRAVANAVRVPVIASGGAGTPEHVAHAFKAGASAAIVSSMLYSPRLEQNYTVDDIKRALRRRLRTAGAPDQRGRLEGLTGGSVHR
jgi:cyclase